MKTFSVIKRWTELKFLVFLTKNFAKLYEDHSFVCVSIGLSTSAFGLDTTVCDFKVVGVGVLDNLISTRKSRILF